jgi:hypothetical protein
MFGCASLECTYMMSGRVQELLCGPQANPTQLVHCPFMWLPVDAPRAALAHYSIHKAGGSLQWTGAGSAAANRKLFTKTGAELASRFPRCSAKDHSAGTVT